MTKYHINAKGVPAICRAEKGRCPFGGKGDHYDSPEQAQEAADRIFKSEFGYIPEENKPSVNKITFNPKGNSNYKMTRTTSLNKQEKSMNNSSPRPQSATKPQMNNAQREALKEELRQEILREQELERIQREQEKRKEEELIAQIRKEEAVKARKQAIREIEERRENDRIRKARAERAKEEAEDEIRALYGA